MTDSKFLKALNSVVSDECIKIEEPDEPHIFSDDFEKDMKTLISKRKKIYFSIINTIGKRIACIIVIFVVGAFATVMNVEAARNAIAQFFISVFEEFSNITYSGDEKAPETIEQVYGIAYDLSDYNIDFEIKSEYSYSIGYSKNADNIVFTQDIKSNYDVNWDTEGTTVENIMLGEVEAVCFFNKGYYNLIWNTDEYVFSVSTNISKDALIEMAGSVQIVE